MGWFVVLIKVKNYEHFNRSFPKWDTPKGKYIRSKKQYDEEMARGGFVSYDEGQGRVEQHKNKKYTYSDLSPKAQSIIKAASLMRDKKGKIKCEGRLIDGMKEVGVKFSVPDWLPKHYAI